MAGQWIIWHNPRCSTSRFVLQALRDAGLEPEVRDYQADPPSAEELRAAVARMGGTARDLLRRKSPDHERLGLGDDSLSDAELIAAMAEYPNLIERPVVFTPDGRATMCRPKQVVFDVIGG